MTREGAQYKQAIERAFKESVAAGIGRWIDDTDPIFGQSICEFRDLDVQISVFQNGMMYCRGSEEYMWKWTEMSNVELVTLLELVRLRGPDATARITAKVRDNRVVLEVPYKVFSVLGPLLCQIADSLAAD